MAGKPPKVGSKGMKGHVTRTSLRLLVKDDLVKLALKLQKEITSKDNEISKLQRRIAQFQAKEKELLEMIAGPKVVEKGSEVEAAKVTPKETPYLVSALVGKYEIRTMRREEVDFAVELAASEGWNPGIHDADCFYATDPKGFLIGLLDGQPISCISAVNYGGSFGFMGFYIVKKEYRHRNYGIRIWEKAMDYLEDCDVGLDGVVQQMANYAKSGFEFAYLSSRYEGTARGPSAKVTDPRIVNLSEISFDELKRYDDPLFPTPRHIFLDRWINLPESVALGIMQDRQLAGYAVLRKCRVGYKVGPLFANDESLADALFQALSCRIPEGTPIFLDVPGETENPEATKLAHKHDMKMVFRTARMYRLRNFSEMDLPLDRWFGVTSFELG